MSVHARFAGAAITAADGWQLHRVSRRRV